MMFDTSIKLIELFYVTVFFAGMALLFIFRKLISRKFKEVFKKEKFVTCNIMKEYGGSYQLIKRVYVNIKDTSFEDHGHTYIIKLKHAVFNKGLKPTLYYVQNNLDPIIFRQSDTTVDNKVLTSILETTIFNKVFHAQRDKYFIAVIMVFGIALIVVSIIAVYFVFNSQQAVLEFIDKIRTGEYVIG